MFKSLNTKDNARVVLSVINTMLFVLMFMTTLILFYQTIHYYLNGFTIILIIYSFLLILFITIFGGYKLGEARVIDQALSHGLGFVFSNGLMYFILCLISFRMLSIWPILILTILDCALVAYLLFIENRYIRDNYPVLRAIAIVGEEHYNVLDKIDRYKDILVSVNRRYEAKDIDFDFLDFILRDVDRVITVDITHEEKKKVFKACYDKKIRVYDIPSITDILFASSDIMHVIDSPILKVNKFGPSALESVVKRCVDIIGSLILIVLTSPIMLVVAIAIKVQDGGDILFKQIRLTKDNKEFKIYKFRSMIMNAEKNTGAVIAKEGDSRITKVGKFIRKTRFDELPQLFNILKGDMSFVGPRPERPELHNEIVRTMPEFNYRLVVKAGLTGYAQIYGKYNTTMKDKLLLDMYYIERYSLIDDIKLLLMTVKIIFVPESSEGVVEEKNKNE